MESFGFEERRSRGSHHTFLNPDGLKITVPKKGGRMVKGVYVRQIIKLLDLEDQEKSSDETLIPQVRTESPVFLKNGKF